MENERLLTINEWLDVIGCDRAYRKDMKETYTKTLPELQVQDIKTRQAVAKEIFEGIESISRTYRTETRWGESGALGLKYYDTSLKEADTIIIEPDKYISLKSRYLEGK
jgi:hypothetical protein